MSVRFLTPGRMLTPNVALQPGKLFGATLIPTTVGVMRRDDSKVVLVDVGFSQDELLDPAGRLGRLQSLFFGLRGTREDSAVAQLARAGIAATDVVAIVATHLHTDHVGGFCDFPNAEIVAPAAEYASARARGKLRGYLHIGPIVQCGRARPVRLHGEGRHGFPAHLDLFGDGRVLLLDARGHTAGSLAVLLTDPGTGQAHLMAGDAAYSPGEYREGRQSPLARITAFRDDWLRATWGRLGAFGDAHPETPIVLSHDAEAFSHLPLVA